MTLRQSLVTFLCLCALAACKKEKPPAAATNLNAANRVTLRTVQLYFETAELLLAPEQRQVALPENPAGALSAVIRELIKGSANASIPRLWPADTVVRAVYLVPDGTAVVDLGGPTLTQGWSTGTHQELMAMYSVVHTVTANFPAAKRVRILVNGAPSETLAGHISLALALRPKPELLARAAIRAPSPPPAAVPPQ